MLRTSLQGPPSQDTVAWRAVGLHALVIRAEFEYAFQITPDPEAPELAGLALRVRALGAWMGKQDVHRHLTLRERALVARPLGGWPEAEVVDISWRKESLGVLLWALSCLVEMPPYDREFPDQVHLEGIGWLLPVREFLERAALRPLEELLHAHEVAELWLWRARATRMQQAQPRLAKRYNLLQIIREAAAKGHESGDIPPPIAGDFPALGRSYARLKDQDRAVARSIAEERHFALHWLCGEAEDWEQPESA